MAVEIFYFSGTGNSLLVAKSIARRLGQASLAPVVGCLQEGRTTSNADVVGFAFPIHALCIPIAVRRFLRKLRVKRQAYLFALATREGTAFHGFKQMNRLLGRNGQRLSAEFVVTMNTTDPRARGYQPPSAAELGGVRRRIETELDTIAATIKNGGTQRWNEKTPPIPTPYGHMRNYIIERLVVLAHKASEYLGGVNYFYADTKCTGCRICQTVCLSGKIHADDAGKPVWEKSVLCYMCFACVNFCPKEAVQIRSIWAVTSHTESNGRYGHPFATASAIAGQKAPVAGSIDRTPVVPPSRKAD
jgi:ferredoxin